MRQNVLTALGAIAALWLARNLYYICLVLPDEAAQGAIYRNLFFHLGAWATCFSAFFVAGIASVGYLVKRNPWYDTLAVSCVEVGVAYTLVGLATGSIWARIIWGIWWTWDARLTWAFITCLVYSGYLMLRRAIDDPSARAKNAAVLCTFAFVAVMITYKSIEWWRTQHPGPVLSFRTGGGSIDPMMESAVYHNIGAMMLIGIVMIAVRMRQEDMQRQVDSLRRQVHAVA
ncbi:MAG: cytochrome c biogenesis protein CcsA [Bryobacteraceae bacterium]